MNNAQAFLAKVLPWSSQDPAAPAFFNLHYRNVGQDGKLYWGGHASTTLTDMGNTLAWLQRSPTTRDMYICMSSQLKCETRTSKAGRPYTVAIRFAEYAVRLRSLFVDIDVKPDAYKTTEEAFGAFQKFLHDSGLPEPTVCVLTGSGGFHVHWTTDADMTPAQWTPLAFALAYAVQKHGLKADTQCTIDSARILRVPDTLNYKSDPPKGVTLFAIAPHDYSLATMQAALAPYVGQTPIKVRALSGSIFENGAPNQPRIDEPSDLSSGIELAPFTIKIEDIAKACPFIDNALKTGGEHHDNPKWFLTTSIATFCEDPRLTAHRLGNRHAGYSAEQTDAQFDRVMGDHEKRNIGWPQCAKIDMAGAPECKSCPLRQQNKSPLNFAIPTKATVEVLPDDPNIAPLPDVYHRDDHGLIFLRKVQDDNSIASMLVNDYPMRAGWLQDNPWALHFETITRMGKETKVQMPLDELVAMGGMPRVLSEHGIVMSERHTKLTKEFFVAWIRKLQQGKDTVVSSTPFGWATAGGKIEGFVYGGRLWGEGTDRAAAIDDVVLASTFAPHGDIEPWKEAAKLITNQKRPSLDAVVAAAFAGPLVRFCGEDGVLFSVFSTESGANKTTAMRVAASVWGHYKLSAQTLKDTENSLFGRMGKTRSIPVFWDELKEDEQMKRFAGMVYQLSQGIEKSRMNADTSLRARGMWSTMLVSACNDSLVDFINASAKGNNAGIARLFEGYVDPPTTLGRLPTGEAARILAKIEDHYGNAGLAYAKFLGSQHELIAREAAALQDMIHADVNSQQHERFWVVTMTTILLGARYANKLGLTDIDWGALKEYLYKTLDRMRGIVVQSPVDMKSKDSVSNVFAQFLNDMASKHTLHTNVVWGTPKYSGRPPANAVKVFNDRSKTDGIYVQIGRDDHIMRISRSYLTRWLDSRELPKSAFFTGLEEKFGMKNGKARMAGGTDVVSALEYVIDFDLTHPGMVGFVE